MFLKNNLASYFDQLPDPRFRRSRKHELLDILFIALCAVVCGAESFAEIAQWGRSNQKWLSGLLPLPHGIPSHDTIGRLFARLDRQAFATCFRTWTLSLQEKTDGEIISLDGKWLRNSFDKAAGIDSLKLVSAWANTARLVLAQRAVETGSNESATLPRLLELLDIEGCIVTIDAAGCHKEIARQIVEKKGDYVLSLKGNQESLAETVADNFADWEAKQWQIPFAYAHACLRSKGHGRQEKRDCFVVACSDFVDVSGDWKGFKSIVMLRSERKIGDKVSLDRRYFITSLGGDGDGDGDRGGDDVGVARRVLRAVRSHWGIENRLHWVLDVVYGEDQCRVRTGNAAQNLSVLRQITLNLLRQSPDKKTSLRMKRKRAGWEMPYLEEILTGVARETNTDEENTNIAS
jgi:predicted transposase YbfD/YdcC